MGLCIKKYFFGSGIFDIVDAVDVVPASVLGKFSSLSGRMQIKELVAHASESMVGVGTFCDGYANGCDQCTWKRVVIMCAPSTVVRTELRISTSR